MRNAGLTAWFEDGETGPGDRRRALRNDGQTTVATGARLVALRGARHGLSRRCGNVPLAGDGRRDYCSSCQANEDVKHNHSVRMEAIRAVLDRATPVILGGTVSLDFPGREFEIQENFVECTDDDIPVLRAL
jgi:hypothetical protein